MAGFAPMLPLSPDDENGYELIQDALSVIKQNLKMLVLCNPGERIMMPEFGVGMMTYLFEPNGQTTYGNIRSAVNTQVEKYLPFVKIEEILFNVPGLAPEQVNISIIYTIQPLDLTDSLEIATSTMANGLSTSTHASGKFNFQA
jgi:hypothetical protein